MSKYDWKPILCAKCKQLGHMEDMCKVGIVCRWIAKPTPSVPTTDTNKG